MKSQKHSKKEMQYTFFTLKGGRGIWPTLLVSNNQYDVYFLHDWLKYVGNTQWLESLVLQKHSNE